MVGYSQQQDDNFRALLDQKLHAAGVGSSDVKVVPADGQGVRIVCKPGPDYGFDLYPMGQGPVRELYAAGDAVDVNFCDPSGRPVIIAYAPQFLPREAVAQEVFAAHAAADASMLLKGSYNSGREDCRIFTDKSSEQDNYCPSCIIHEACANQIPGCADFQAQLGQNPGGLSDPQTRGRAGVWSAIICAHLRKDALLGDHSSFETFSWSATRRLYGGGNQRSEQARPNDPQSGFRQQADEQSYRDAEDQVKTAGLHRIDGGPPQWYGPPDVPGAFQSADQPPGSPK